MSNYSAGSTSTPNEEEAPSSPFNTVMNPLYNRIRAWSNTGVPGLGARGVNRDPRNPPVADLSADIQMAHVPSGKQTNKTKAQKVGSNKMVRQGSKKKKRRTNGQDDGSDDNSELRILPHGKSTVIMNDGVNVGLTKSKKISVLTHRALVVFMAIVFLWSTSLGVCRALVSYVIASPPPDDVLCVCNAAYEYTTEYQDYYVECVTCEGAICELDYTAAIDSELLKVSTLEGRNRDTVTTFLANQELCSNGRTEANRILQKYAGVGLNWVLASDEKQAQLTQFVGSNGAPLACQIEDGMLTLTGVQNVQSARQSSLDVARAFADQAGADISVLSNYVDERSDYDASYLDSKFGNISITVGEFPGIVDPSIVAVDIVPTVGVNLTLVINCMSADPPPGFDPSTCPGAAMAETLGAVYAQSAENIEDTLEEADQALTESYDAAVAYSESVEQRLVRLNEQVVTLEDALSQATAALGDLADGAGIATPFFDVDLLGPVDIPAFPETSFITDLPDVSTDLPSFEEIDAVINTDALYTNMVNSMNRTAEAVENRVEGMANEVEAKANEVEEKLTPNDYDPPQCCEYENTEGDVVVMSNTEIEEKNEQDRETFDQRHAASLNAFSEASTEDDLTEYNPPTYNASAFDLEELLDTSSFTFEFVPLTSADYPINWLFGQIDGIYGLLVLLDFIWRGARTFQLIVRYYSKAAIAGAPLDVKKEKLLAQGCTGCESSWAIISRILLSPLIPLFLALFLIFFIASVVSNTYVPFFKDYTNGCKDNGQLITSCNDITSSAECVTTQISQNTPCRWIPSSEECIWDRDTEFEPTPDDFRYGTIVTDNLYSMAYNYASEEGNNEFWSTLDDYNVRSSSNCAEYGQASIEEYDSRNRDFESSISLLDFMRDDFLVMSYCLDYEQMDSDLDANLGGSNPAYATFTTDDSLSQYLDDTDGAMHGDCFDNVRSRELTDSRFDCAKLPECQIECNGVEWDVVRTWTYGCGCYIEWWFHSSFLLFSLAIIVYICLNLGRNLFVSGVCLVFFDKLGTNLFEYHGTCDREGRSLTEDKELKRQLKINLRTRCTWGVWYMIGATLLQVPWVVMLSLLSGQVELGNLTAFSTCDTVATNEYSCPLIPGGGQ